MENFQFKSFMANYSDIRRRYGRVARSHFAIDILVVGRSM